MPRINIQFLSRYTEKAHELDALRSQLAVQYDNDKKSLQGELDHQLTSVRESHEQDVQHMKGELPFFIKLPGCIHL